MKKFTSVIMMAFVVLMSMTLASCDEDTEIAYTLEGTWQGDMEVSMVYDNRVYDAMYSELCFSRDPYRYSSGTGYWIDYYNHGPWGRNYVANHIEWTVSNRSINIYLVEEGTYIQIYNYTLSDNYFVGTIYYGDQMVDFRLRHTSSPNWGSFEYGYYDDYYAKQGTVDGTTRGSEEKYVKPQRRFGR